jgi:hypothetical protein
VTAVAIASDGIARHHQRRLDAADLGPHHWVTSTPLCESTTSLRIAPATKRTRSEHYAERSVESSAQPTQVRTLDLPPVVKSAPDQC